MTFKVGDRVKMAPRMQKHYPDHAAKTLIGTLEIIRSGDDFDFPCGVRFDGREGIRFFARKELELLPSSKTADSVNSPSHYNWLPNGLEVIDLTENLNFSRGNAVKYLCRAGRKNPATELEDLKKARWYVDREIARVEKEKTQRA